MGRTMAVITALLIALAPAAHALPDCSKTGCPSTCQCTEQNCAAEINSCLADPTCAGGQGCVEKCGCGDMGCLTSCAFKHPSAKALPLLQCLSSHCKPAFENTTVHAMPDCSQTACPSVCQCTEQNCVPEINACLADPTCAGGQDCTFKCACGDMACLTACAWKHPSLKAMPLLKCLASHCKPAIEVRAMPDCSKTGCPSTCQCTEQNCAAEINSCLADPTCAGGQGCVEKCGCGDMGCLTSCAFKHPSAKALPLLQCLASHCKPADVVV